MHYYTNCNETADAFFCKQGIVSNDKGDKVDIFPYTSKCNFMRQN
jgi:hypothetical protein